MFIGSKCLISNWRLWWGRSFWVYRTNSLRNYNFQVRGVQCELSDWEILDSWRLSKKIFQVIINLHFHENYAELLHGSNLNENYLSLICFCYLRYNFDGFCLGVLFTNRIFDDLVLGLSWRGNPKPDGVGGICQHRVRIKSDKNAYSFNALFISLKSSQVIFLNKLKPLSI